MLEAAKAAWAEGEAERRAAAAMLEEARAEAAKGKVAVLPLPTKTVMALQTYHYAWPASSAGAGRDYSVLASSHSLIDKGIVPRIVEAAGCILVITRMNSAAADLGGCAAGEGQGVGGGGAGAVAATHPPGSEGAPVARERG